jgi:hypothetical protein
VRHTRATLTRLAPCPQAFHCRYGKAYLFNAVSNVRTGPREERLMTTGMHVVADIWCIQCASVVGWKYEEAFETAQRYKENKFILEKCKLVDEECNELRSDTDD